MNPYTKENPGNFANDRQRASKAGKTTAKKYLDEAKKINSRDENKSRV